MATSTTRLGIRRVTTADLFKPYSVDLPSIVDTIDQKAVQFRSVLSALQVRDIGEAAQIRAGRVLAPADFTRMGLTAPLGLWNLGDVNDASGNARTLTNKGTVPFGPGIMGAATEAAIFAGSTSQALYIADTGASDPFRIRAGSWWGWMRQAKRGTGGAVISKWGAAGLAAWDLSITGANVASVVVSANGNSAVSGTDFLQVVGTTDVCDDRWHFLVGTHDGTVLRLYVDGVLEGSGRFPLLIFPGAAPLNVGGRATDAATANSLPHYGRVDEAGVTSDVLSPEQVLNLYCARIAHTMTDGSGAALAPTGARIGVRRRKRGRSLLVGDFPATPLRLYNLEGGSVTDGGTNATNLTSPTGGTPTAVAGPDGSGGGSPLIGGAISLGGAHNGYSATDTGLPSGTAARSYGCWFKTSANATGGLIGWGTITTADVRLSVAVTTGVIFSNNGGDQMNGPFVADGLWHHAAVVEDNAAADGVKRKLYLDGRLVVGSTVLNSITLAGANRFRVGAWPDGTSPFTGQLSRAWVYNGALTAEQVHALYSVGSQALSASPKAEGDHVEAVEASGLLAHFDTLEGCDLVDLSVVA